MLPQNTYIKKYNKIRTVMLRLRGRTGKERNMERTTQKQDLDI